MRLSRLVLAAVVALAVGNVCLAADTVKTVKGAFPGKVVGISPVQIELEPSTGGASKEFPVNQVLTVFFATEPPDLKTAKSHVLGGHYAEALAALERIKEAASRPEAQQQDIAFYKALCAAKLALAGSGKIADAGRMMTVFADANSQSYHYFEASQMVGDLLAAIGQYAPAAEYYGRLAKAPWPECKMRAGVAMGRALLARGKIEEARKAFDEVTATAATGEPAETQRTLAELGKAAALVADKKPDQAVKMVEGIVNSADPENAPVMARAYDVLGAAHRQAGRTTEALLAFLHVDLRYSSVPDAHAEALANLAELLEQVHRTDKANLARKTLQTQYPETPWAKKGE